MKKVVIVNCFDTYEHRVDLVHEFFKDQGYDVTVIQSDFRHFKKVHREKPKEDFIFVKSKPYYKNLSIPRLSSHYKYADDAFKIVEELKPDLLYTFVPPNSLAKFAAKYKEKHKKVELILDLIDLWPETMPIGDVKKFPPFKYWGAMRDKSLKYADLVITECDLYQTVLSDFLRGVNVKTIYLANRDISVASNPQINEENLNLLYLGSINNIIDIPLIKEIIRSINKVKPVTLHIIGDGESKQQLIDSASAGGAIVKYYGKIYDNQDKQDIIDKCHFGLNIMKNSVCVGLTMKSIDYFQHGLPIINNIPADTSKIVIKYGVGINVTNDFDFFEKNINEFTNLNSLDCMKRNASKLFREKFSVDAFNSSLDNAIKDQSIYEK